MRENVIETSLKKAVLLRGGIALKLVSPSMNGIPDRLVLLPDSKIGFIELKATGKKQRLLQKKRQDYLKSLGYKVYCIDRIEQIGGILDEIQTT